MELKLTLKPSKLGQYYEMHCDKYLVYNSIGEDKIRELGWEKPKGNKETAAARAGNEWERILLERLQKDKACEVICLKSEDDHEKAFQTTVNALKALKTKDKPVFLYQACFRVTPSFLKKYLSAFDGKVTFSNRMYPDFIKAEYIPTKDKFRLTIIDAKNAGFLKVGAEIQIALYVKLLKEIIACEHIDNCFVDEDEGIVWNREKITDNRLEHPFNLRDASAEVDAFFDKKLTEIRGVIDPNSPEDVREKLDYRVSHKCEYCDNLASCKQYCAEKRSVRIMPYITTGAQDRVVELIGKGLLPDDSLESVMALLESNPDLLTEDCSYWKNVKNNLQPYTEGMKAFFAGETKRIPKTGSSISFPKGQNFSLLLTAQLDANSGRAYAFAWLLRPGKGIDIWGQGLNEHGFVSIYEGKESAPGKGTYYDSVVALDNTPEEFDRIDKVFVESIFELLSRISVLEKRRLQCYVMDDYERSNIESVLYNMLEYLDPTAEQELLEKVMTILFWLQGERLVTDAKKEPEKCVENPVTVLTSELSRLYVLSEGITYNLRGASAFFSPEYNLKGENELCLGLLTNSVEGMLAIWAWEEKDGKKKKEKIEYLARHLRMRLFVEERIIEAIQKDGNDEQIQIHLSAIPMLYEMHEPAYPNAPEMARLDFESRYEQLLEYHQIRGIRASGIQNAIDNGTILWLEYTGKGNKFKILNRETYIGRDWFMAWLCEDTPENRKQIMLLRDTDFTSKSGAWFVPKYEVDTTVFFPNGFDMNYDIADDGHEATLDFCPREEAPFDPETGKKYLLFEVYKDENSAKSAKGIADLINRPELLDPVRMSGPTGLQYDAAVEDVCKQFWSPDGNAFSPSQKKAFIHLMENKLNLVVGPPASGKTDFIARALITIAGYYKTKMSRNLKIMVTAMSHSAIDNVLLKLQKMLKKANPCEIKLYKAKRFDDVQAFDGETVTLLDDRDIADQMNKDEIQIIGMTCWSAYKAFFNNRNRKKRFFDMIVMDEASQVRAMDAFLNLECSNGNSRFLLVGDDDQLPPIIHGKYKEAEGEKYIHGSIFRMYLTGLGEGHPDILQLTDNYRMNGILCKYSAKALYGPDYKASNEAVRTQKILLNGKPAGTGTEEKFLASLLEEDYPLVFCELSGIAREQTETEIHLVKRLVHELWDHQLNESGKKASEEGNFWREAVVNGETLEGACGIISPHHEHINRLKTGIANELHCDRKSIYIGTVEKLQGKERKTVIVSYGVSENEKIKNESEFIFSRNRLNVSITRGKAKTIVFLSDAIAEPNLTTNILTANDNALKKGIDFIHGFSAWMKEKNPGEDLVAENYLFGDVCVKVWKKKLS